jgi:hypothetical protein
MENRRAGISSQKPELLIFTTVKTQIEQAAEDNTPTCFYGRPFKAQWLLYEYVPSAITG